MYPHVGVDASGLATLRATVLDLLRGFVPTAYAVPALAVTAAPVGPCYALADGGAAVGRRGRSTGATTARRPAADSDSARMMDLVERAQAGEADAFGRLYDQYSDTVYRYIYYRVGGKATAEDLTSETFLRALRRIGTFTWQGRDFGAWLVTIARNLVADHFKSSRFRLEVTTGEMLDANEVERSPRTPFWSPSPTPPSWKPYGGSTPSSRSASPSASSRACPSPRRPGPWARTRAPSRPFSTGPSAPWPDCCRTTRAERFTGTDPVLSATSNSPSVKVC